MTGGRRVMLGVLDWGIGGLDVVRKLRAAGVHTPIAYVSDAGAVPYGKQDDEALAARVAQIVEALAERGCREVIVGCNAASTVLAHGAVTRAAEAVERVSGVIEPAIEAVIESRVPEVVVIGGARTIASRAYADPLERAGVEVRQRVAQPLSALIEAGVLQGPRLHACVKAILGPVADGTALVSACTHYLAVEPALRESMPRLQTLIDPAAELVRRRFSSSPGDASCRFWTTGAPGASSRAAAAAFGIEAHFERAPSDLEPARTPSR